MKAHLIVQALIVMIFVVAEVDDGYKWCMTALGWFILTEMLRPPYSK